MNPEISKLDDLVTSAIFTTLFIMSVITITTITCAQEVQAQKNTLPSSNRAVLHGTSISENITLSGGKYFTYQNSSYGIKIQYPSDWKYIPRALQKEQIHTIALFVPPKLAIQGMLDPSAGLKIGIQNQPGPLSYIVNSTVGNLKQTVPGFHVIESGPSPNVTFAGNSSAYKIIFTTTGQKSMAIFTIKNERLYLIRYFAPPEKYSIYLPIIQKMIDSFEIINPSTKANATKLPNKSNLTHSFLTYQNSSYGIKIQYPSDWNKEQPNNANTAVTFVSPANSVVNIWISDLLPQTTLANDTTAVINLLKKSLPGFSLTSTESTSAAGSPAKRIIFIAKLAKSDTQGMQIIGIKGKKEYAITFTASKDQYPKDLPIIQKMIDSFDITK
jgi:hypothetical protein